MINFNYRKFILITIILGIISFLVFFGFRDEVQGYLETEDIYLEANQAYYDGNLALAIENYSRIVRYEPGSRAAINLAVVYEEMGDYEQAVKQYTRYLREHSLDFEIKLYLEIAHFNLGRLDLAEKGLKNLLNNENLSSVVLAEGSYYLSKIYLRNEKIQEALTYAEIALETNPRYALAAIQKGLIYEGLGSENEAITYYLKALRIDGSLKGVQRQLGLLYLKQNDYDKAYYRLEKAITENKQDQFSKAQITWLEKEFPGRFKSQTSPPQVKDLPENVNFKEIQPLPEMENIQKIKVGLSGGDVQKMIFFRVGSSFQVKDKNGNILAEGLEGQIWKAEEKKGQYELVSYPDGKPLRFSESITIEPISYAPILIHGIQFGKGYYWSGKEDRQYRGQLELIPNLGGLRLVNIVNVEDYLYSVVASEMSASWPLEALKVQAVAARTYTYFHLGRHSSSGYDLCDTVHCAAYNGIGWERNSTRQAVAETLGIIMTYKDRPINALYSANSGGHTEDVKDVWGMAVPYLLGVSTLKDQEVDQFPLEPAELKNWLINQPDSYSADPNFTSSIHFRWERQVSRKFIEDRLQIGELKELKVTGRGKGGSVISILAIGTEGEVELKNSLRSKLGGLRSNRFFLRPEFENGKLIAYRFYGGGWGHSVGMDQVAAAGMANSGFSYDQILNHFYTGIDMVEKY
ncbi:MAG: SpoIID/LytB domain-containing protein [Halanaerobiales bacterium]|nr:SpoIID/LytB domain-containing protein [Halanaerobiales bacterium]